MSKINISGIVRNIKSKSNIYTPIVEAIVNSIEAIGNKDNGKIEITLYRENILDFENCKPSVQSIKIVDNGMGFTDANRKSFDTYLSDAKIQNGGKGFGRFMYLKYFDNAIIESQYQGEDKYKFRNFRFGKKDEIIVDEQTGNATEQYTGTCLLLENVLDPSLLDKGLEVIERKLVERLLVYFVNEDFKAPQIILQEADNSERHILNDYINDNSAISKVGNKNIKILSTRLKTDFPFVINVYKIYYSTQSSKICLTAHNREVTETTLQSYIPEFQEEFYDIENERKRNFIIKAYVLGKYLNDNVSLERESFDFEKETDDNTFFPLSQTEIEFEVAQVVKEFFSRDVKSRFEKKKTRIYEYVTNQAPWHQSYLNEFDMTDLPMNLSDEKIELEFQKFKFKKEQEVKFEINEILKQNTGNEKKLKEIISRISKNGKNDLAHYVCNRKMVIEAFDSLRKRRETDNKAHLEAELHNLIFPMGESSHSIDYENHNLWLLDERLVFSQYIASDKVISKKDTKEPDLVTFHDKRLIYRNGENITTSPVTIFEFKRPKRTNYNADENPIIQACNYSEKIRAGKYEMPDGLEVIKISKETPVYIYIVADPCEKITEFAKGFSLTLTPDAEGYIGYSSGYDAYIEIMSFKKLICDAKMRNRIFFKKLGIE